MNPADWVIVAFVALMALQGFARGFLVAVASLGGFAGGALLGSRIAPVLLSQGSHSPYAPLFALGGALLAGMVLGGIFERFARRIRRFVWFPPFRLADGLAGALLTVAIALGVVWISGSALLQGANGFQLPASLRQDLEHSTILKALDRVLPPSGPILNSLARIDPFPTVSGRIAAVAAPDPRIVRAGGVRRATGSVVKVLGTACGLGVEGSGWVAAPGLVVTNAHVVAGETRTFVQRRGRGPALPATVVLFDPHNDIALLRVPRLHAAPLALAMGPAPGESGAILGYPLDGPFRREAGRLGQTQYTATEDAYGDPALRDISSLRGLVRPGNSGGPLVDATGQVLATVFAQVTDAPKGEPGGFAVPDSVVASELARGARATAGVSTQSCAT